jgi:very-short-patch-repair endonuclease
MKDARVAHRAGEQFNRISRQQLFDLGLSEKAITHRVNSGRFVLVEQGVYAVAPVLVHDDWGRWMAATLTAPGSVLSHLSAAAARGVLADGRLITITRPGDGGPRRHGDVVVHRSTTLEGDVDVLCRIPITSVARMLVDIAPHVSQRALARALRESIRLGQTTVEEVADALGRHRRRRGVRRLAATLARYAGLPVERARSGAEVRALQGLRDAGFVMARLNVDVAGEEADLSWPRLRLIVEIDGKPFHLDVGEDARKQAIWAAAGWTVRRIPADVIYEDLNAFLALIATSNVPRASL